MSRTPCQQVAGLAYELRFEPLVLDDQHHVDAFVFPCDAKGTVDLDTLSAQALNDYLFARHQVGRHLSWPEVWVTAAQELDT